MRAPLAAALASAALLSPRAAGAVPEPAPMKDIDVAERVGQKVPLDLALTEAGGERVRLGDYFEEDTPVLLVLAYVRCEMLCSLVLQGTANTVKELEMAPGEDYRVLTVSIDPRETPAEARDKQTELLEKVGRPGERARWPYLLGEEESVRRLADSLGFGYAWDERTEQYAHPAVIFALAPDGTIARYFHGLEYPAAEVKDALESAARGETVVSEVAQSVLSCFRFDPALREQRSAIQRYFRIGATAIMMILGSSVLWLFLWERKRRRRS